MTSVRLFPLDVAHLPSMLFGSPTLRVEQYTDSDAYIVRAEAPGVDPEKDIKVSVADGRLTIAVERTEQRVDKTHSEFHYGTFSRTVQLPPAAAEDRITAKYDHGILTIRVPMATQPAAGREIPVKGPATAKQTRPGG
jgi:HSP20 family protein